MVTIFRRDLGAYFTSPIGYIFMIVYLLISVGLYITSFFTFPVADMRPYFDNLPILLCVFIPAVTMRVWAEERKENTWELLLTFPMRARELVVGKFFACLVFFAVTLVGTITVPIMLASLGNPDNGTIFCGYLGTVLLGAFFLAIGIFFSGFFKDQIVAFVVTLLTCFAVFLLGTNFIASYIDGMKPGLGSLLSQLVGVFDHYTSSTRGVIELGDVLYFVAWTALFLVLNVMYIEGRGRPRSKSIFAGALILCVAIGLLFNWLISGQSVGRFDLTEDKVFTVSEASRKILSALNTPVQVSLYITPKDKMPTGMTQLEQNIADKLEELRVASGNKIAYKSVHMEVANVLAPAEPEKKQEEGEQKEEDVLEKRMLDKGVEPFSVRAIGEDEVTNKLVYSSIGVGYKNKEEEIIPQVVPQNLDELEYRLISTVYKLTREKEPVVAMVAPKEAVSIDPQMRRMLEQMGQPVPASEDPYADIEQYLRYEKYDVRRVELTEDSPMPAEYDTLLVLNPRMLNDRQRWDINRAVVSGKSVILAVQNYEWDYRPTGRGISMTRRDEKPQVNELLKEYGVEVSEELLMDVNHVPLTIQGGGNTLRALLGQPFDSPMHILINNTSMDQTTSITSRLSSIFYLWGSPLKLDEDKLKQLGLTVHALMSTTDEAWSAPNADKPTAATFEQPATGTKRFPLMAMVAGQFPDAFKDKPRPEWPEEPQMPNQPPKPPKPPRPEDAEAGPVTAAPGKLILLGCSEMFRKNFLQAGNLDLVMNAVDGVTLGDDLVNVRSRKPIDRVIDKPKNSVRAFWKFVNYALAPSIIAAAGIVSAVMRTRARNEYTMKYAAAK
jgi:ABC-type uncharacterized transport system involved in gliding motility auxiliary subunit